MKNYDLLFPWGSLFIFKIHSSLDVFYFLLFEYFHTLLSIPKDIFLPYTYQVLPNFRTTCSQYVVLRPATNLQLLKITNYLVIVKKSTFSDPILDLQTWTVWTWAPTIVFKVGLQIILIQVQVWELLFYKDEITSSFG
jgi:hypothetical protein